LQYPLDLLKHCITLSGDFWDVCAFFCCYVQPLLATAEKLITAFWKLHLKGAVQIELPLLFMLGGDGGEGEILTIKDIIF